ncbi:MAG: GerW family sporulation protein [Ruminococcus sp.]|uniref:GerW family sporulation protein n=1 Tax=Ruminococcus sp. TaxID=41978 RepID=UPI00386BB8CE|nr:GerW family sporulation protein [Ruminococcus sp.]MBQ1897923.1 GerW family sporulation protein [Ruminococcus sp.]MBQ4238119.1 GerW family sporulation protein [Ruminococcus sp.]
MSEHPINSIMDTSLKKIKELIDVNSIIGDPITAPDGTTIIPISKVTYGFASGGSDLPTKKDSKDCFGGGAGAGVTIQPVGFLSISKGNVKFIPIEKYDGAADRIVGMIPEAFDKISSFIKKDKTDKTDLENDLDSFDV